MRQKREIPIYLHYLVKNFSLSHRSALKQFLFRSIQKEGRKIETINYIFCSDSYLLSLNKEHLNHHTLTDIISFELSAPKMPLLADIYISTDRIKENASIFEVTFRQELHRVIFHGALHLCGYKDKSPGDAKKMRQMEEEWLKKYFNRQL